MIYSTHRRGPATNAASGIRIIAGCIGISFALFYIGPSSTIRHTYLINHAAGMHNVLLNIKVHSDLSYCLNHHRQGTNDYLNNGSYRITTPAEKTATSLLNISLAFACLFPFIIAGVDVAELKPVLTRLFFLGNRISIVFNNYRLPGMILQKILAEEILKNPSVHSL
jgi:hypothetical protein